MKKDAVKDLKPGVNDEKIIGPPLIKGVNDSLKENEQMIRLDSLIMEKRKLELKKEIPLKDSLNIKNNRSTRDTSRVKD